MPNNINKQILSDVNESTDQLKNQVIQINKALDDLLKRQKDLVDAGEKSGKAYQDVAAQVRVARDALKETTARIDANTKSLNSARNSLQQNKGFLEALKAQYDELSKSQGANSKEAKALNIQIGTLSNTIAQQEEKLEKSRKVFDLHSETNKTFTESFNKLKLVSGDFGPSLASAAEGFNAMKSGLSAVKTGFQSVGGAIKTTGFGLLVLVLQSVVEYFTNTTEGAKKLKNIISAVGAVVKIFKEGLSSLGKIIIDAFSNPVDSIKKLGQALIDNVINRFKAILVIWDGIKNMDFKKISNGVLQAATGVTNLTDKATMAFKEVMKAKEAYDNHDEKLHKNLQTRHQQKIQMHEQQSNAHNETIKQKKELIGVETEYQALLGKQLQETANTMAKKVESEHNNYAIEKTALKNLYDKKLTTQEQYLQESQKLEEKYHLGIADIVKGKNTDDLDKMQKQQKDLLDAQTQNKLLNADQHDVNKALPWNKLDADKKLITDKYNFEIQKAAEAGKDTAEIRKQYEKEITDVTKQFEQQRKDFAIQTAQQISSAAFSIIGNSIKSQTDAKIKGLENDKAHELSNKNLTSTQKQAIEQKYKQKENQAKLKAFKDEQKLSLAQALINGALAITKVTSQTGVLAPFVIPGIIASTAIQVAEILKQKPPAFARGGHFISDGRGALLPGYSRTDNTNAYLRSGEAVVVSEAMRNPWARNLISAINVAHGGRDFSIPNAGRGYAVGGIFTDGGNANRYYNQPVNDVKDLANTLAYQMINNFPPVYVDVKDINNQQNILAQTINRVNL